MEKITEKMRRAVIPAILAAAFFVLKADLIVDPMALFLYNLREILEWLVPAILVIAAVVIVIIVIVRKRRKNRKKEN